MEYQTAAGPQHHHVIPPTAERAVPAQQPNMPAYQQGEDTIIQNCSCLQCSEVRGIQADPHTGDPVRQQDPRHFNAVAPSPNQYQGVDSRAETVMIVPDRAWEQFVPPQTAGFEDPFSYAPIHERAGPSSMGFPLAPTLDASIAESRRRLAGQYVNNPNAYVSTIHLEPGLSGQLQVIITLEMASAV
ncbi:hypothetical protein EDB85DRAFT_1999628 [Lactarius pseudohatsudake]|nr:hypothetical protein EDB85DRAFT_1999628 [Lactarius pseudohatsudake]